jgi:hypothetical protein
MLKNQVKKRVKIVVEIFPKNAEKPTPNILL